ncbi:hypothetical protein [Streptomyces sp. NPDC047028]|uniref:hypothetical protein n=1 Tax=Streptomyces sp. NPDC047028 TaxID=3155793 RepID=UPI0033CB40B7
MDDFSLDDLSSFDSLEVGELIVSSDAVASLTSDHMLAKGGASCFSTVPCASCCCCC